MPGHDLKEGQVKNKSLFSKYRCHSCSLTLRDAVQPLCGHWLCESCIQSLLKLPSPECPRSDCKEPLKDEDCDEDQCYFPDNFVRREIKNLSIFCEWSDKGCTWEGKLVDYDDHLKVCEYVVQECSKCGKVLDENHQCAEGLTCCPVVPLGCEHKQMMTEESVISHIEGSLTEHLKIMTKAIVEVKSDQQKIFKMSSNVQPASHPPRKLYDDDDDGYNSGRLQSITTSNSVWPPTVSTKGIPKGLTPLGVGDTEKDGPRPESNKKLSMSLQDPSHVPFHERAYLYNTVSASDVVNEDLLAKIMAKVDAVVKSDLRRKDDEIMALKSTVLKLEKTVKAKHAELEDRDFRLSLIENSNYDGTMVWKIPQFSQRMSDAHSGKYTSIFSLPFYTSRYGYKMCLRLYILGDGIGKGNYMSLFFVIMRGEFDNILQWPFIHKVTFRLINQSGNRDVIDTFQPEPTSSSFRKPKSDMNIASGCPRFISHTDLKNKGFVVDDTIFIKCEVDTKGIQVI